MSKEDRLLMVLIQEEKDFLKVSNKKKKEQKMVTHQDLVEALNTVRELNRFEIYQEFVADKRSPKVSYDRQLEWSLMGLSSEVGEVHAVYEKALRKKGKLDHTDVDKFEDELGDVLFWLVNTADILGLNFEDILNKNIIKLSKRIDKEPERFGL